MTMVQSPTHRRKIRFSAQKKNFHEPPSKGAMEEAFRLVASELGWSIAETKDIILAR